VAAFFFDHNVSARLSNALTAIGHTSQTARDLSLTTTPDYEILAMAARNRWIVVTHNAKDFALLHGAWQAWPPDWGIPSSPPHGGILILSHAINASAFVDAVVRLFATIGNPANRLFEWRPRSQWVER
jgi:hypothetical protein